jgi:hypothetical protein
MYLEAGGEKIYRPMRTLDVANLSVFSLALITNGSATENGLRDLHVKAVE